MNESEVRRPSDSRHNTPESDAMGRISRTPSQGSGSVAIQSQDDLDELFGVMGVDSFSYAD